MARLQLLCRRRSAEQQYDHVYLVFNDDDYVEPNKHADTDSKRYGKRMY
jgi:hypothetical protein